MFLKQLFSFPKYNEAETSHIKIFLHRRCRRWKSSSLDFGVVVVLDDGLASPPPDAHEDGEADGEDEVEAPEDEHQDEGESEEQSVAVVVLTRVVVLHRAVAAVGHDGRPKVDHQQDHGRDEANGQSDVLDLDEGDAGVRDGCQNVEDPGGNQDKRNIEIARDPVRIFAANSDHPNAHLEIISG